MNSLKRLVLVLVAGACLAAAAPAAAAPTAGIAVMLDPQGKIYSDATRPVNMTLDVAVSPEPGASTLKPMVKVLLELPKGVGFKPDNKKTPVCKAVNDINSNVPPSAVIARCPDSVLGNGRADLYLAQQVSALVVDPVLTIFNRGRNNKGQPEIGVHAYSISTNQGIYMQAALKNRKLEVAIPRLTADSSVPGFRFNIPGGNGQDPAYVQAKCATGSWVSRASITLANRSATGQTTDRQVIDTPKYTEACKGRKGGKKQGGGGGNGGEGGGSQGASPRLRGLRVGGPTAISRRGVWKFNVRVRNKGAATMRKVRITTTGRWVKKRTHKVAKLRKGSTRWYPVRVSLVGGAPSGGTTVVKFKVNGSGVRARTVTRRVLILYPGGEVEGRG